MLHGQILEKMKERMKGWTATQDNGSPIGDIIVELIPCLKLYVDYVNGFQDSVDLFNKVLEENKKLSALVEVRAGLPATLAQTRTRTLTRTSYMQCLGGAGWTGILGFESMRIVRIFLLTVESQLSSSLLFRFPFKRSLDMYYC